jgi:hypothetical protein
MLPALSAVVVSCATLALRLFHRPAVPLDPGVLLLGLVLQLPPAGLCAAHLVPLQLVRGDGPPPLRVPRMDLQHHVGGRKILDLLQRLRPDSRAAFSRSSRSSDTSRATPSSSAPEATARPASAVASRASRSRCLAAAGASTALPHSSSPSSPSLSPSRGRGGPPPPPPRPPREGVDGESGSYGGAGWAGSLAQEWVLR